MSFFLVKSKLCFLEVLCRFWRRNLSTQFYHLSFGLQLYTTSGFPRSIRFWPLARRGLVCYMFRFTLDYLIVMLLLYLVFFFFYLLFNDFVISLKISKTPNFLQFNQPYTSYLFDAIWPSFQLCWINWFWTKPSFH